MDDVPPFPLIDLSGTPEACGEFYGRQAADRVRRSLGHYHAQLTQGGLDARRIHVLARAFVPRVEAFEAAYVADMRGIARGADVAFEDVMLLNCRTEILQLARRGTPAEEDPDGCTGAILLPEATADGGLLHGQNWDWKSECAETGVVLRIRREDGPDILTFVEAGGLTRVVMQQGRIVEAGDRDAALDQPHHDYTRAQLAAAPKPPRLAPTVDGVLAMPEARRPGADPK